MTNRMTKRPIPIKLRNMNPRPFRPPVLLLLIVAGCAARPPATQPSTAARDEWRPLFNGHSLDGWQPAGSAIWRVDHREGWPSMIVGGQEDDPKRSGTLSTVEQFQNFEVEFEFMIDEHGKYNSGVYLRNPPAGTRGKNGYQVNIGRAAAAEYTGGIVITDAPGTPPGTPTWLAKGDETDAYRTVLDWNTLRVLADGPHLVVHLNGHKVADVTDTDPKRDPRYQQKGTLAFQTYGAENHAGWVKFRNLRIRQLPDTPVPSTRPVAASARP
jgi:hypothetical protein